MEEKLVEVKAYSTWRGDPVCLVHEFLMSEIGLPHTARKHFSLKSYDELGHESEHYVHDSRGFYSIEGIEPGHLLEVIGGHYFQVVDVSILPEPLFLHEATLTLRHLSPEEGFAMVNERKQAGFERSCLLVAIGMLPRMPDEDLIQELTTRGYRVLKG